MLAGASQDDKAVCDEIWRRIPSNTRYFVSNLGRVRHERGNIKKLQINKDGYVRISLYNKGFTGTHNVAALVAEAFIGKRPIGMTIDHIDGNKTNSSSDNLEYVTQRENVHRLHSRRGKPVGVYYCKKANRYNAQISKGRDKITLGWFKTEEEASAAYKAARKVIEKWID